MRAKGVGVVLCAMIGSGVLLVVAAPAHSALLDPGLRCEKAAAARLRVCTRKVTAAVERCYAEQGDPCPPADSDVARALAALDDRVRRRCPNDVAVQAAGYGPLMTTDALVARLAEACRGEAATLAARAFGGPHGAALAAADADARTCLSTAYRQGSRLLDKPFRLQSTCVARTRAGRACDTGAVATKVAAESARALEEIGAVCSNLAGLIAVDPAEFVARAEAQVRCMLATAHPDPAPLGLDCGPRSVVTVPPRGVATQIVLDEATWGSRCGDGSSYAFQVRLAPAGAAAEKVAVFMQGGGVCLVESDCAAVSPGLLRALDNGMPSGGFFSTSAATNPTFHDWTQVYLPYCTQDVHIGGGATSNFPSRTIHRFGAVNVRAALRYVRDMLWTELDASSADGFRPDRLRVLFAGISAGGFGASYNYHYVVDDLRWAHTTAVPDSALGLANGQPIGIAALWLLFTSDTPPLGWGSRSFLAPYCLSQNCAVVPVLHAAHAARLLAVPVQQILSVSNQVDTTQVSTTFFANLPSWITALRTAYCAQQGLPGVRFFLPATGSSLHGVLNSNTQFVSLSAAGVALRDWLGGVVSAPESLADAVSEGGLAAQYGIAPFGCPVAP